MSEPPVWKIRVESPSGNEVVDFVYPEYLPNDRRPAEALFSEAFKRMIDSVFYSEPAA